MEISDQIRIWESQIFIIDRECEQNRKMYSRSAINDFLLTRASLVDKIEILKQQLSNDTK